ncbi:hypothetical protein CPB86DRAFT_103679 [Serendipita vermifera]|nr:hypothetical protein CPB86DRAFT_103679 [Serendipita vermifera]
MSSSKQPESRHDLDIQNPTQNLFTDEKHAITTPPAQNIAYNFPSGMDLPFAKDSTPPNPPARKFGRLPRFLYGGIGLIIVTLWIGLTLYIAKTETSWSALQQNEFDQILRNADINKTSAISLEGALKDFNTISRTLTIEWSGLFRDLGNLEMDPVPLANGTYPNLPFPVEIYRDVPTTLWIWADRYEPGREHELLWYKLYNDSVRPIAVIGLTEEDSFETEISFKQATGKNELTRLPLFGYPYDEWSGSISFIANDGWANRHWGLNKSFVFPLTSARLTDHTLNWRFDLVPTNDCEYEKPNITTVLSQLNVGPDYDLTRLNNETLSWVVVPCRLKLDLHATRPPLVRFAAVLSLIVNWTSTFFVFVLTCEVIVMGRGYMLSGTDLLGVTFTSLFALPSVRLLLPGAPDFGALSAPHRYHP